MPTTGRKANRGCLTLFALPFAGVGVVVIGNLAWTMVRIALAQTWVQTPARILEARLQPGGETTHVEARYAYTFAGSAYESTRVSFYSGSDNIGSFHQDCYAELSRHLSNEEAAGVEVDVRQAAGPMFRCFVNPHAPGESVLYRQVRPGMTLLQLVFGLVFGGVGFGLLFGTQIAARMAKKQLLQREQFPGEPWKWREDWATGVLRADRASAKFLLLFAVFWNAISWPIAILAVPAGLAEGKKIVLVVLLFPLIGSVVAIAAIRELLRVRRFGGATLRLATVPGVIGGRLAGLVQLPSKVQAEGGFHLKVTCSRSVTTGSGKNRHTKEHLLWEDERLLAGDALRDPTQTALPVLFAIPHDQPDSDPDAPSPVHWRLEATAKNPGVDLAVRFDLPVFRTAESSPHFQLDDAPLKPYLAQIAPRDLLREAGVRVEENARGTAFVFPAASSLGHAFAVTAFALIWTGAVAGMAYARVKGNGPPWFFVGIFGFVDLFVLWGLLDAWFGCGRIDVERGTLRWKKGLFGLGSRGEVAAGSPVELEVVAGSQSGSTLRYQVALAGPAWKRTRISRELRGKRAAEVLIAEIRRALGRA